MERPFRLKLGNNERMSFSRIKEVMEVPNLIEVQLKSYDWFVEQGLKEVFRDVNRITDYTGDLVLEFIDYSLNDEPKYSVEECKERDTTYSAPLRVKVRLINRATGEVKEQEIFMGDFPLMTDTGTFVINGAERVIVSQLVRSPGIYYTKEFDKTGKEIFANTVIPNRGAWLEYETDSNDIFYVRIDRTRKLPVTVLLRAIGYGTDQQIIDLLGDDEKIISTLHKDIARSAEEGLIEIYKRLRPGEPPTQESASLLLSGLFFDPKRYDLAKVGRHKFDKKLALAARITGRTASRSIINTVTGELFAEKDTVITYDKAAAIQNSGVNEVYVYAPDEKEIKVIGNGTVDIKEYVDFDVPDFTFEKARYDILSQLLEKYNDKDELKEALYANMDALSPKNITKEDIVASINYLMTLSHGVGSTDDIDHLGNRRVKAVGELLQNQFRIGLSRLERVVRERMTVQDIDIVTPQALINIRPVSAAIKEFFGSSQLSQFMDQTNPLSELTSKRRLSALGPGGLSRDRAGYEVRDVHSSHYGRICPIETPEGPNIGLIGALSTYARVNQYGFIESPYLKVYHNDKDETVVSEEIYYLTADAEDEYIIAQANAPLDERRHFINKKAVCRLRDKFIEAPVAEIEFMDVSPKQLVSVATAMIPFLENDDANRALMGANMQKQSVPLIKTEAPIIATGIEYKAAVDSGVCVLAKRDGIIRKLAADMIEISTGMGTDKYKLLKYKRSNQGTCINQRPIVKVGQKIKAGQVIADGPSTDEGEIALGRNVLIAFMPWEGYNYEDAILISEELVRDDTFTSIHIEEYECESRDTKLGPEEITRDIPNIGEDSLKDLDEVGIIRIGAEVKSNDILVGKLTPKGETELSPEERLLRAIFGEKAREVRDTSLRVPHGESGIIVDVRVFSRENGDELSPGVNELVRVYIAQKRKISVGDKMAGRHGNKGVISRILPVEDMPFLPDGTPIQVVLNPLGVASRMNVGQVLEVHLGYAAKILGWEIATSVFDGANEKDIFEILKKAGLPEDGKTVLYDGRTGQPFDNRVTVGYMYMLKLLHLVDDKIHARSTGPYSLVTQQPLGGKAQFGGQRFGEMEVWALEAYGAAYSLQEILTVKSDDVVGRVKTYEAIVKGENIPEPGIPESFKVLVKELQSLALDIKLYSEDDEEIELKESIDDDISNLHLNITGRELDDDFDFSEQEKTEIRRTMVPDDYDDFGEDDHNLFKPMDPADESEDTADDDENDEDDL